MGERQGEGHNSSHLLSGYSWLQKEQEQGKESVSAWKGQAQHRGRKEAASNASTPMIST